MLNNKKIDDGGPAFPCDFGGKGMSLRDYFAAKAMQYVIIGITNETDEKSTQESVREDFKYASIIAYEIADAMLEARRESCLKQ